MIYYIVFGKEDAFAGWWCFFTAKKWRHVAIFWGVCSEFKGGYVQHVEYVRGQIKVDVYPFSVVDWVQRLQDTERVNTIIEYRVDKIEPFHYNLRGLMTCVSISKSIIGVKAFFVWTPKQLVRKLLSLGGRELWANL